jgi:signal transduction histidine kinase
LSSIKNILGKGYFFPKMGNYLKIRKNSLLYLAVGFVLTLLVLGVFVFISNRRLSALIDYSDQVEHTYQVIEKIEMLGNLAKDAETAARGFVITKDSLYLEPLFEARRQIPGSLKALKLLTSDNDSQQVRVHNMAATLQARLDILNEALQLIHLGIYEKVMQQKMKKGKAMMDLFRSQLNDLKQEEVVLLNIRFAKKEAYQQLTPSIFKQFSIIIGLIALVLFVFLVIELLRRLGYQKALQQQLQALKQSNDELTRLAFATSHDLQEPVRKMRIFTDRLLSKPNTTLHSEDQMLLTRIDVFARRLQGMLEDISNYMNLVDHEEIKQTISLNNILNALLKKNEAAIKESGAVIKLKILPELLVHPQQMNLLFLALLDNALKFSKTEEPARITIYSEQVKADQIKDMPSATLHHSYWVVHFKDEGIGFERQYSQKIFQLFQRLHNNTAYSGKGIGLAICQRVMGNHEGFIIADAAPDKGADFQLFFPIN